MKVNLQITAALFLLCFASRPVLSLDSATVLVFPLDGSQNSASLSWVSEGVAISISSQIEGHNVKVIDRNGRINLVERADLPPGAQLSRASMIRVAQQASADLIVMGSFSGTEQDLRISIRVLDVKGLKLSREMVANGPVSALPKMENELSWQILNHTGLGQDYTRPRFQERIRKIPNAAYYYYIQSLNAPSENDQLRLLLKSLERYRSFPEAQFLVSRIYFHKGDCRSAMSHLLLGRSDESNQLESEFMKGTCFLQQDMTAEAIQSFSHIMSVSRSLGVLNNAGVAYLRKGDYTQAATILVEARNLSRSDPTVALNLAIVQHIQGNDAGARRILEDTLKSHPKSGMLNFLFGFILKSSGEADKSRAALAKAKSLRINVDKLQTQDPKDWSRVLSKWNSSSL
jgi:tetratricopeptide (TPR) repeat protein/TolB-like protein